jgi:hypothetical protein
MDPLATAGGIGADGGDTISLNTQRRRHNHQGTG